MPIPERGLLLRAASLLACFFLLLMAAPPSEAAAPDVRCEGCHAGGPRIVTDPRTGATRNIAVDIAGLRRSEHGRLSCRTCHTGRFTIFPHPRDRTTRSCSDCHPRQGKEAAADAVHDFPRIVREFERSAHAKVKGFRCESCHPPHAFRSLASLATTSAILTHQNGPCLACHRRRAAGPLAGPAKRGLPAEHLFLPRPERHLAATRCVDCHRGSAPPVSHLLPAASRTERACTSCHRRDSILRTGLYRHRPEGGTLLGFTNPPILEDAYVMAATRNLPLDLVTYAAGSGVLLLAGAYGMRRRRRAVPAVSPEPVIPPLPLWLRLWHGITALLFLLLLASGAVLHFGLGGYRTATILHEWGGILLAAFWIPHLVWLAASGSGRRYRPGAEMPGAWSLLRAYLRAMGAGAPLPGEAKEGEINRLQALAYRSVLYLLIPLLILTGLLHLVPERLPQRFLGLAGTWPVALAHHLLAVAAFLFLLAHLFMLAFGPAPRRRLRRIFGPAPE